MRDGSSRGLSVHETGEGGEEEHQDEWVAGEILRYPVIIQDYDSLGAGAGSHV